MFALLFSNGDYIGYKKLDYEGEEETFELEYQLVEELPTALTDIPKGHYVRYDSDSEQFFHEPIPEVEPEPLTLEEMVAQLEQENVQNALALVELYEMILAQQGGGAE